jgi:hypothetical protein
MTRPVPRSSCRRWAKYRLPQSTGEGGCYAETCASIACMMTSERVLSWGLDGHVRDTILRQAVLGRVEAFKRGFGPDSARGVHFVVDRVPEQPLCVVQELPSEVCCRSGEVEGSDGVPEDVVLVVQREVGLRVARGSARRGGATPPWCQSETHSTL